jgi:hypothetical protein
MTLKKTYLFWLIGWIISSFAGAGAYLVVMHSTYGNFSGHEDFDGLPYFIGSIILIVFLTGWVSAFLIHLTNKKRKLHQVDSIARSLVAFHFVMTFLGVATFMFGFLFFNIFGFLMFITLPIFAWHAAQNIESRKKWIKIFIGCLAFIVLQEAIVLYSFIAFDPTKH